MTGGGLPARPWLRRVALSLLAALLCGGLVFLAARGIGGALLFVQQQQTLAAVVGVAQGGLEQPPDADLRALRRSLQAQDAQNEQISLLLGFVAAGLAAAGCYVWLELRRTENREPRTQNRTLHRRDAEDAEAGR
ncbi:MAG TPA: hypothetical protein VFS21_23495 [Roseiflexaceae bacterium]|nr:hypothetical protein [Roseiflexaceae bacterium]